jgi:AraC family transcriptional regulator
MVIEAVHGNGVTSRRALLAEGKGWRVSDVVFRVGAGQSRFEDRHEHVFIGAVTQGSFRYRSKHGRVTLMPGALLLGNAGDAFECAYEHGVGDRCISFHYTAEGFARMVAGTPGARRSGFRMHRLPPAPAMIALTAAIEAQAGFADAARLEELALRVAGDVASAVNGGAAAPVQPSARDETRILDALHLIEARHSEPLSVLTIADAVGMSPYHFLRVFRAVVGVTPYQYLVRTRLRRTAIALATTEQPIAAIAFAHGFGDLSTFVATFGRVFQQPPRDYRRAARAGRARAS